MVVAAVDIARNRSVFVAGALLDSGPRAVIFGRTLHGKAATVLPDSLDKGDPTDRLRHGDTRIHGIQLDGLTDTDLARLSFFVSAIGQWIGPASVSVNDFTSSMPAVLKTGPGIDPAQVWTAWADGPWPGIVRALARDVMAAYPDGDPAALCARLPAMLVRAASRVRAETSAPHTMRYSAVPDDVRIARQKTPYAAFFSVEEYDVSWRQFRGPMGVPARRAVFVSGDAVTVLPYDPVRDRVLLIEQFRPGPMARGDAQPWLLEPIAGRIDPGETPQDAARREAVEEAGLTLGALLPVAGYYPTPGAKSEYLYSYVALCDLPDDTTGIFGLAEETEDIRSHLVGFDDLMALVASGEAANAPLILTALWLQRERGRLQGGRG